ncbi:hypothetical protein Bca4012_077635 [Brassica carinata]
MNKATEIVVSAVAGAFASEVLKLAIGEAKLVFAFGYVSKELASTMEDLLPIVTEVESMQDVGELKTLKDTIDKARVVVEECKSVKKNQGKHSLTLEAINICIRTICNRIDLMDVRPRVYTNLCPVPKIDDKVHVGLDWPLMKLKMKVFWCLLSLDAERPPSLLIFATTKKSKVYAFNNLSLHLYTWNFVFIIIYSVCFHLADKFNHIFYSVVSGTPNFRKIVQNLLQHNGFEAVTFENDPQAANALVDLIEELTEDGPVLLVLDDVWLGADDLLKYFRFKLPGYKILVTSRSDLPSFDYTYPLQPLNEKDAKALLVHVAPRPYNAPQAEYEEVLRKILKRCNGLPLLIEVLGVTLKGKPLYYWKGQVESWSEKETNLDGVLKLLQPSFTTLEPHLKECFMDMGSFLEDQKIRASVIIDIWVELYGKSPTSSSLAYMKYLDDLASQNLLKLIPLGRKEHEDGFYNELLVTQHDVLRELAIHQSKQEAVLERKRHSLVIQGDNYPDDLLLSQRESVRFLSISTGLRKLPLEIGRLDKLKKISMNKCWKCELPDSVRNLENLEVKCDEETEMVLWKGLEEKMINLNVQVEETEHNLNLLRLL